MAETTLATVSARHRDPVVGEEDAEVVATTRSGLILIKSKCKKTLLKTTVPRS